MSDSDEEEKGEVEARLEIFVHTLDGHPDGYTMKVTGFVVHQLMQILINLGSTHNFIHKRLGKKLQCQISTILPRYVTIANGG